MANRNRKEQQHQQHHRPKNTRLGVTLTSLGVVLIGSFLSGFPTELLVQPHLGRLAFYSSAGLIGVIMVVAGLVVKR